MVMHDFSNKEAIWFNFTVTFDVWIINSGSDFINFFSVTIVCMYASLCMQIFNKKYAE